jgi:hypothetical protein
VRDGRAGTQGPNRAGPPPRRASTRATDTPCAAG